MTIQLTFWGESTGVRALIRHAQQLNRSQGKAAPNWTGETLSGFHNQDLDGLLARQDDVAAVYQTAAYRAEMAATYALRRDQEYTTRSRRWLFTRGLRSRLDGAYEEWRAYTLSNNRLPLTPTLASLKPERLKELSFEQLLNTPSAP